MCHYCQKLNKLESIDSKAAQQLYSILHKLLVTVEPRLGDFFLKRFELTKRFHALLSAVYSKAPASALATMIKDTEHELLLLKKGISTHPPVHDVGKLKKLRGQLRPEESSSRQLITTYNVPAAGNTNEATMQHKTKTIQRGGRMNTSGKACLGRTSPLHPPAMKKAHPKGLIEAWLEKVEDEDKQHQRAPRAPPAFRRNDRIRHDNISSEKQVPQNSVRRATPDSSEQTHNLHRRHEKLSRQRPTLEATEGHPREHRRVSNEGEARSPTRGVISSRNPTKVRSTSTSELSFSNSGIEEMSSKSSTTNMGSLMRQHVPHDASSYDNQSVPRRVKFADEVDYFAYPQPATEEPPEKPQTSRYQHLSLLSTLSDRGNRAEESNGGHDIPLEVTEGWKGRHVDRRRRSVDLEWDDYRLEERERFWNGNFRS